MSHSDNGDSADEPRRGRDLLPQVYEELRRLARKNLAREAPGHTLQATALVHEAYMRLGGDGSKNWDNKGHFCAAAAEAMRRILVDSSRRRRRRQKHLGDVAANGDGTVKDPDRGDFVDIDQALRQLERESPKRADVVKLKFFGGCTLDEAAEYLGVARSTVAEHWKYAKAWLLRHMRSGHDEDPPKKGPTEPDSDTPPDA